MGTPDWLDKAEALEVKHKGTPVLSHPNIISSEEAQWAEERQEEERGRQAHQALSDLFSSFDEE